MTNFDKEFARAIGKYPPELWAEMDTWDMYYALQREVEELKAALWANDLHGEHGIIREAIHCQVVAERIKVEMERRHGM